MRRLALISEHASPVSLPGSVDSGGQNVYVGQLARHLAALGHEVDVFTRRDDPRLPQVAMLAPRLRLVHVPAGPAAPVRKEALLPHMAAFTGWMRRLCRRRPRYDLVHANFWMSGLVAADLKRALRLPFVITFHALGRVRRLHQQAADGFPDERFAVEDRIVAEADRIVAECPQDAGDLVRLYRADPASLTMVPCGVDPNEFFPMPRRPARVALGLPADGPLLLQLGRLVPRKGVGTVVQGLARLRRDHGIAARLVVVGGESDTPDPERTPEIARLMGVAREAGVLDHVIFTGRRPVEVLRDYYAACDVFVTLPWYEPFGITPLEAMACARPVVGAAAGGIAYTVLDGETGYLVPPRDPAAMAERVARLLRAPALAGAFGQRGLARVRERFTWTEVTRQMLAMYEDVLATAGAWGRTVAATRRRARDPGASTRAAAGNAAGETVAAPWRRSTARRRA